MGRQERMVMVDGEVEEALVGEEVVSEVVVADSEVGLGEVEEAVMEVDGDDLLLLFEQGVLGSWMVDTLGKPKNMYSWLL